MNTASGSSVLLATITALSAASCFLPFLITATTATPVSSDVSALGYLQKFGFLNESSNGSSAALVTGEAFTSAIKEFQKFSQIEETGKLDAQTLQMMNAPRCGNKDRGHVHDGRRSKRYALQGSKWKRMDLTYRITVYPRKLKKALVDREIARAFKVWSDITPLNFILKKEGKVHIDIRFVVSEHGDGDPFDGPGNTLAHAYFPQYGGDAHFDDEEYWTVDSYSGTNLFQVAAHELGHSLGLGHSSVRESLMAPFYQRYKPNFSLHKDDVLGIQALYGQRTAPQNPLPDFSTPDATPAAPPMRPRFPGSPGAGNPMSPPRVPPVSPEVPKSPGSPPASPDGGSSGPDLCQDGKIDAVTRTADGSTYVFKGDFYFKVEANGLADGYPRRISTDWDGLPGNLDAALTWSDGKTFFFKGSKYWKFSDRKMASGYPKEISVGFAGIPSNIDAAFVWSGNGKTYFFKGDQYWRFDSRADPPVSNRYPKPLKNWVGLPSSVDAAFRWQNGLTYFFKANKYYRFNDAEFEVDSKAKPPFPRQTSVWWFDCKSAQVNPLGLSSDLRASIYVGNSTHGQSASLLEEPLTVSPAGYSSHALQVDKDVEMVSSPALADHTNPAESLLTHEANSNAAFSSALAFNHLSSGSINLVLSALLLIIFNLQRVHV